MKYAFIEDYSKEFPVKLMCQVLGVSTSGFCDWKKRGLSPRGQRKLDVMRLIESIHLNSRKLYGSPRITKSLNNQGVKISQSNVSQWMRTAGLRSKTKRKYRVATTNSNHKMPVAANILDRQFSPVKLDSVLTSNITCIRKDEGWLYLAVTLDLCSKKCAGWSMGQTMTEKLVTNALKMALGRVNIDEKAVHHSDRGSQ